MGKPRKPDFVRISGRCRLALWIDQGEKDGKPYKRIRLGFTKSEFYKDEWHESTVYFYPDDIGNMQALLNDFQVNHMVRCPTTQDGQVSEGA